MSAADAYWLSTDCDGFSANHKAIGKELIARGVDQVDMELGGWANDLMSGQLASLRRYSDEHGTEELCAHVAERLSRDWEQTFFNRP